MSIQICSYELKVLNVISYFLYFKKEYPGAVIFSVNVSVEKIKGLSNYDKI